MTKAAAPRLAVVLLLFCQSLLPTAAEAGKLGSTILQLYTAGPNANNALALSLREVATGKRLWLVRPSDPSGYFDLAQVGDDGYVYTTEVSGHGTSKSCIRHATNGSVAVCEALPGDSGEEYFPLDPTCVVSPGVRTDGYGGPYTLYVFNVAAHGTPLTWLANLTLPSETNPGDPEILSAAPDLVFLDPGFTGVMYAYATQGSDAGKMLWAFNYTARVPRAQAQDTFVSFISNSNDSKDALFLTVTVMGSDGETNDDDHDDDDYDDDDIPEHDTIVLMGVDRNSGQQLWATNLDSNFDWCEPGNIRTKYNATLILCQGRAAQDNNVNGNWWLFSTADGSVADHGTIPADPAGGQLQFYDPMDGGFLITVVHPTRRYCTVSFLPLSARTLAWSKTFPPGTIVAAASDYQHILLRTKEASLGLDLKGNVLWNATNEVLGVDGVTLYPDPYGWLPSNAVPFCLW